VKAVYALYPNGQSAQEGVNRLRSAGLADRDITILSGVPMEHFEFGQIDSKNRMWWLACGGALVGLTTAFSLAWIMQTWWPINVGALPVFAWWPSLIIMFELTMLGAILTTVVALLVTGGLPGRGGQKLYDKAVTEGQILVGVENPAEASVAAYERALSAPPGAVVKKI
jgi:hypothetical protein